ncbi:Mrm1p NDAI_0E01610 [Naumovozyma dairenensis CBS 421]|uniref:rRNA methyltransferase 1, mitochondrial n=1 Tax=Naumovozyma dairenensis (strain ATCC 10597 / BCRC 20456 / CBS 421 / NBRC 0211 / NRRL Y-12639) TaxID=1071378 RepID=G0WB57_NAUDC|nr:hypothetical protein NDAI_0E01610 [Naumovozyma dairenensis CBS 421]CCD24977.1 hypothetical protein NDAI_0E01610 [Naumovozyma dairenensis CBS 421]
MIKNGNAIATLRLFRTNRFSFKRELSIKPGIVTTKGKNSRGNDGSIKFEKNIPIYGRPKAWELAKEDKETWFKRKYAHVHARRKMERAEEEGGNRNVDPYGKKEAHLERLRRYSDVKRSQYENHRTKFQKVNPLSGLQINPLMEYIYGTNCVLIALKQNKREYFNRLWYHGRLNDELIQLCKERDVELIETDKHRLNLLTNYAVHNNVVLETKPLDIMEISHLTMCDPTIGEFGFKEVGFDRNDLTDHTMKYICNFTEGEGDREEVSIKTRNRTKKYPFGLFLDEVVDPHNMGAIIRSAYFLGVDFIVLTRKNCAPLSPVVLKTSSGSMECMPIFCVDKPLQFFTDSQREGGWAFITSHVSDANGKIKDLKYIKDKILDLHDLSGKCLDFPIMLVIGNEGAGVRTNLRMRSDFFVEIPFGRKQEILGPGNKMGLPIVDSLNVSVATALLINSILN